VQFSITCFKFNGLKDNIILYEYMLVLNNWNCSYDSFRTFLILDNKMLVKGSVRPDEKGVESRLNR